MPNHALQPSVLARALDPHLTLVVLLTIETAR